MNDHGRPDGWTVVLRRQPVRIVENRPEGGYADAYELVCCDCGDDPDLDYREVSPELQRIRGPYPIAEGVAAYQKHAGRHRRRQAITSQAARCAMSTAQPRRGDPASVAAVRSAETVIGQRREL
jgi:hypothetical protein